MIRIPKLSSIQNRFRIILPALLLLIVIFGSLTTLKSEAPSQNGKENNLELDASISAGQNVRASLELQPNASEGKSKSEYQIISELSLETNKRLISILLFFLGAGFVLLGVSWWFIRKPVISSLFDLRFSANQIESGDLNPLTTKLGSEETKVLGRKLNTKRVKFLALRQNLQQRISTFENRDQKRTKALETLTTVSREISSSYSINEVINSVTSKAQELSNSEIASLCMLDRQLKVLNLRSASGLETAIQQSQTPAEGPGVEDVLLQSRAHSYGLQYCQGFCQIINPVYRTSHLAVSLRSENNVIGALCIGSAKPDSFRPKIELILTQLAKVAAVTIENAKRYQQAKQTATMEERERVSSEMHDGLLQTLSFLGNMVRMAKDQMIRGNLNKAYSTLQQIERAEAQAENEIRRAIYNLQDNFPLNITLQEQLTIVAIELSKSDPPIQFESETVLPLLLVHQENEQVLRIVREGLLNAQRHSQSEIIRLSLKVVQNEITITIKDQGIGFDPSVAPNDNREHFGIKIMQARAARLGGKLTIQSSQGTGTIINLSWTPSSALHQQTRTD